MSRGKQAPKRKRARKAAPVLGIASLSLSLVAGASAAIGRVPSDVTRSRAQEVTLSDEEISEVSLTTFYVVDAENAGGTRPRTRLALGACGGCAGCGGCGGCWGGSYDGYGPPPIWNNADAPPAPMNPTHKYRHPAKSKTAPRTDRTRD
jgi:hypothetical protein